MKIFFLFLSELKFFYNKRQISSRSTNEFIKVQLNVYIADAQGEFITQRFG